LARYEISPERSEVRIAARSSLHPIEAMTHGLEGFLEAEVGADGELDLSVSPKGRLDLPVDRLSSGNALYDREMKRRIDARRYRTITGELTEMKRTGEPTRYLVGGDVTFRGVRRHFEDEMSLSVLDEEGVSLEGTHVFDIRDFDMEPPKIMMLKVYPDVSVTVKIVALVGH
jgi:polyisoprenoid-binding protein YceI